MGTMLAISYFLFVQWLLLQVALNSSHVSVMSHFHMDHSTCIKKIIMKLLIENINVAFENSTLHYNKNNKLLDMILSANSYVLLKVKHLILTSMKTGGGHLCEKFRICEKRWAFFKNKKIDFWRMDILSLLSVWLIDWLICLLRLINLFTSLRQKLNKPLFIIHHSSFPSNMPVKNCRIIYIWTGTSADDQYSIYVLSVRRATHTRCTPHPPKNK